MHAPAMYPATELWRTKYPAIIGAFLSIFQLILTLVIVGCEIGGDFVHFPRMNAFVGYWTFPNFMCAWISLAGSSCCCRIRCCGITALVFQCLAIPMALCVMGFDGYFLNNPTQCFFSDDCSSFTNTYNYNYNYGYYFNSTYYNNDLFNLVPLYGIKIPLIKGQLAAGVLMFVACVIYIIIFIITTYRVRKGAEFQSPAQPRIGNNQQFLHINPFINPGAGHVPNNIPVQQTSAIPMNEFHTTPYNSEQ